MGSEHTGAMVALVPSPADLARLVLPGGEPAAELHLTLFYLGDAADHGPDVRAALVVALQVLVERRELTAVAGRAFGANWWNPDGDEPAWVLAVGDAEPEPEGTALEDVRLAVLDEMAATDGLRWPEQHSPFAAHVCLAYSDDPALLAELAARTGPVTFDRLRVAFGDEVTDIPLLPSALAAAAAPPARREPTPVEAAASTDYEAIQEEWEASLEELVAAWATITVAQREELAAQVTAAVDAEDLAALGALSVTSAAGAALLVEYLLYLSELAAEQMAEEAARQGVEAPAPPPDGGHLAEVAAASSALLAAGLAQAAGKMAMHVYEQGVAAGREVADAVDEHLAGLSDRALRDQLGGALSAAQAAGRFAVLEAAPDADLYAASEILDSATCDPCREIDGTEFDDLADARAAYPMGRFRDCEGRERCRGLVLAVWDRASLAASVAADGTMPARDVAYPEVDQMTAQHTAPARTEAAGGKPTEGTSKDKRLRRNRYDADGEAAPDSPGYWEGVLTVEGVETGDGREFAPGALAWADLPLPLMWQKETSHGGGTDVSVRVGSVTEVWRDESMIRGRGQFDLGGPEDDDAHEAWRRMSAGYLSGNSVDVDSVKDADVEFVWPEPPEGAAEEEGADILSLLMGAPEKMIFHKGRIRGTTLVEFPAFDEARLSLTAAPAGPQAAEAERETLTAAITNWRPPAAWFVDPQFDGPHPITVTEDGRVFGHAATWGQCHIGVENECVTPPREAQHSYYLTGEVTCDSGYTAAVGQITVGTKHPDLYLGARPAAEHYDNTGCAVADVTVGNDRHGIWVAGAVRPNVEPWRVHELRAAGAISGDWRRVRGKLRLVGLLAVNVAGFPVGRTRARVASGQVQALVAAAGHAHVDRVFLDDPDSQQRALRAKMDQMAERIGRPRPVEAEAV